MANGTGRDLEYFQGGTRMLGRLCDPVGDASGAGLLVVHGAHGLGDHIADCAARMAGLGHAVLAVDLWGDRKLLTNPAEIGPMLDRFASDHAMWMGRLEAARMALAAATGAQKIGIVGYCFGGSSALEFVRSGGAVDAAVSLHGGLDNVGDDWSSATRTASVLICTGAQDPLAKPEDLSRIEAGLSQAGIGWETNLYGGAKHAFTEPDRPGSPPFAAYDARADRRSWAAMSDFLSATLAA